MSRLIAGCLLFTAACSTPSPSPPPAASGTVTLFEGARLITGHDEAPIENSAFIVENGRFSRVGARGELQTVGATTMDTATGEAIAAALMVASPNPRAMVAMVVESFLSTLRPSQY